MNSSSSRLASARLVNRPSIKSSLVSVAKKLSTTAFCFPLGTYFGGMKASIDALRDDLPPEISEIMKLDRNNGLEAPA